jgi:hypothetical protein
MHAFDKEGAKRRTHVRRKRSYCGRMPSMIHSHVVEGSTLLATFRVTMDCPAVDRTRDG